MNYRRYRVFVVVCGFILGLTSLTLAADASRESLAGQEWHVVTDVWPPFRIEQGSGFSGIDVDLLKALSIRLGLRLRLSRAPWGRCLKMLETGAADAMIGLARRAEREKYIKYVPTSYYACAPRFYMLADRGVSVASYGDLEGMRVGYVAQSSYFEPFDSDSTLHKYSVATERQLLELLLAGRVDVMVGTDCQVEYELAEAELLSRVVAAAYRPDFHTRLYLGISKKSRFAQRIALFDSAIRDLLANGTIKRIRASYLPESSASGR